ncbi:MAG: hypothetical protein ACI31G_00140 [Bacilli bacterium]
MKIFLIDILDLLLIIVIPSVIILGLLIILSTGLYRVKNDEIYIIEKYNEYYKTIDKKGWYYFTPLVYHRAAKYKKGTLSRTIRLENGIDINLIYEIVDVNKYHYSKKKISDNLLEITKDKTNITIEYLNDNFINIGIKIISVDKI